MTNRASKAMGLGLTWRLLPSRADLASPAAPIGDHAAATAAVAQDASAAARVRGRLSHNASLFGSIAEVELSYPMEPRSNASQRSQRRSESFDNDAAGAQVVDEIQGGPQCRVYFSTAVTRRGMDDEPCVDAEDRAADSAKARSIQVRPQCSHCSS